MRSTLFKKMMKCCSLDNIVGLILVILIVFELNVEQSMKQVLNSPPGMILSLVLLIVIFVFMHPLVGILYLIYLYECVKDQGLYMRKFANGASTKTKVMKQLNDNTVKKECDKVEIQTISNMAPIVKKMESMNARFVASTNDPIPYALLS